MTNVIALIPVIVQAVKAIEVMLPQGSGQEKLAAVITTIEAIDNKYGVFFPFFQRVRLVLNQSFP